MNADGILNGNGDITGFNLFAYCSNNPVIYSDPNGMFWKEVKDYFTKGWNKVKSWIKGEEKDSQDSIGIQPVGTYNNGKNSVYIVDESQVSDIMNDAADGSVVINTGDGSMC